MSRRLETLDYLRGLAAFGVMIYHYRFFSGALPHADTFLGKWSIYGVAIFYVLSGLTLHHVYINKMEPNAADLRSFFIKRAFRIYPLLWVAITATLVFSPKLLEPVPMLLSYTGAFSVLQWWKSIGMGTWSIGNELCFYLFFPGFILVAKKLPKLLPLVGALLFGITCYFAFNKLDPTVAIVKQWADYTNPLNQVFLFFAGVCIGHYFRDKELPNTLTVGMLVVALAVFALYPITEKNFTVLVTGPIRLVFIVLSIAICLAFYKLKVELPKPVGAALSRLGEISYSVYLLHPVVWFALVYINDNTLHIPRSILLIPATITTLITAWFVYSKFELYFVRLGAKVAGKPTPKPTATTLAVPQES